MTALWQRLEKVEISQSGSQSPHWDQTVIAYTVSTLIACEATLELCKIALLDRLPDIEEGDDTARALEAVFDTLKALRRQP